MSGIRGEIKEIGFGKSDPFICYAAVYAGEGSPDEVRRAAMSSAVLDGALDPFINAYLV